MSMFEVWLLFVVLPGLHIPIALLGALSLGFLIFGTVFYYTVLEDIDDRIYNYAEGKYVENNNKKEYENKWRPLLFRGYKTAFTTLIVSSVLLSIIPNKREVAAMVVIPYVSDNPEFKKLPANIAKHLNELLDEYLPSKEEVKTNE